MSKKITFKVFIERARNVHGNKYKYYDNYKGARSKIPINCPTHGDFEQRPHDHWSGQGCPKCGKINIIKNNTDSHDEFVKKANIVHNNKYQYPEKYVHNTIKIKILCPKHGLFNQKPCLHLQCRGCPKCGKDSISIKKRITKEEFLDRVNKKHDFKYTYNIKDSFYIMNTIDIICPIHGIFKQTGHNHLYSKGCKKCSFENSAKNRSMTTEKFIELANGVHNFLYEYQDNYINNHSLFKIKCKTHGIFEQRPNHHLKGIGCPKCKKSKGNDRIQDFLIKNNIKHETEKRFKTCKNKKQLPFDFYLTELNILIEFDGHQHFKIIKRSSDENKNIECFEKVKRNDKIKTQWAIDNNIKLIRIPYYDEDKIEEILKPLTKH